MEETLSAISVLSRLGSALNRCNFPSFCLKPLQVKCFECLLRGQDIIAVLPTGFGKSIGYAYGLFERILADKQFVGKTKDPSGRLFAQFHAPQTKRMRKGTISEIKEENSRIRVLFATSALGMGVTAPCVEHIVHNSPPSNLESYMQEIGRAGRTGKPACATLIYNNYDIASNKVHVQEEIKDYCRSEESCLRTVILKYLGFSSVTQERCCCVCYMQCNISVSSAPTVIKPKVREMPAGNEPVLEGLISSEITYFEALTDLSGLILFTYKSESNLAQKIMEGIELIKTESDLLDTFGIWDETCSSKVFSLITHYAPLIQAEASHS